MFIIHSLVLYLAVECVRLDCLSNGISFYSSWTRKIKEEICKSDLENVAQPLLITSHHSRMSIKGPFEEGC